MERKIDMPLARFAIGDVVRHRLLDFRGVIFDVDPEFANSEEWYDSIPEALRPSKDQPFYHLLAENAEATYVAYVSQQNLLPDESDEPVEHPAIASMFDRQDGRYRLRPDLKNEASLFSLLTSGTSTASMLAVIGGSAST